MKDYATSFDQKEKTSRWVAIAIVLVVISGVTGFFYWKFHTQTSAPKMQEAPVLPLLAQAKQKHVTPAPTVTPKKSPTHQYSFYTELAKSPTHPESTTKTPPKATAQPQRIYWLQVAAFKQKTDADSLVKRLKILGFTPKIEMFHRKQGGNWYRVLAGPYITQKVARADRQPIQQQLHLNPMVVAR